MPFLCIVLHLQRVYLPCIETTCCKIQQHIKRKTAMAAFDTTRTAPLGAITTYSFIRFLSNISNSVIAWNDARVTRNSLGKLSDRELDDIGLTRGDIADIANLNRF
jgi:uncharacterized protein YjiS (DUF1127 family)